MCRHAIGHVAPAQTQPHHTVPDTQQGFTQPTSAFPAPAGPSPFIGRTKRASNTPRRHIHAHRRQDPQQSAAAAAASSNSSTQPQGASRFGVQEAEVWSFLPGLSPFEVSTLAAAVRGLSSPSHQVVKAAAVKQLQGITATATIPAAVADALVEVDAVQDLVSLLSSKDSSSSCRAAAAATLCNIAWFAAAKASALAAGAAPVLIAMLSGEQQECRAEAAYALAALTSGHDEAVCAEVAACGGIPRLAAFLEAAAAAAVGSSGSSGSNEHGSGGSGSSVRDDKREGTISEAPNSHTISRANSGSTSSDSTAEGWVVPAAAAAATAATAAAPAGKESTEHGSGGTGNSAAADRPAAADSSQAAPGAAPAAAAAAAAAAPAAAPAANQGTEHVSGGMGNRAAADGPPAAKRHQAAAAPPAAAPAAAVTAAVTALANLAAGDADRRAAVAFTGNALQHIVSCLGSPDAECKAAAVRALLHLTAGTPWKLSDGLLRARVKAAGAPDALHPLLDVSNVGSCYSWDVWRLSGVLVVQSDAHIRLVEPRPAL